MKQESTCIDKDFSMEPSRSRLQDKQEVWAGTPTYPLPVDRLGNRIKVIAMQREQLASVIPVNAVLGWTTVGTTEFGREMVKVLERTRVLRCRSVGGKSTDALCMSSS